MSTLTRLIPFFLAAALHAQPYLNLDFETATRGTAWYWSAGGAGYTISMDAETFQSGAQSMRIRGVNPPANGLGLASQLFPLALVRARHVRVSGWIRTDSVNGYAAIWWRVDGASGILSLDNMAQTGPRGTTDWTYYSYERDVSPNAQQVILGVFLSGTGTAWFDNLQVEIDGVPFDQGNAPYLGEPLPEQLDWVTNTAIPVAGADPSLDLDDLAPLEKLIGNAHVVALGEATHGTSEFFRMKHRIIEYLATHMGFTIFAIEANMPEAYAVNDYVLNGRGDAKELLKGMYFWTWNTQEVLDMIEWMREFNQSGKGRIQFTGFDMQTPDVAEQIVQSFVGKADSAYAAELNRIYGDLQRQTHPASQSFGVATTRLPVEVAAGKKVRYTGYIKTQGITTGYAGLWWRTDGASGALTFDNMSGRGATGTSDWKQYEIDVTVPANATNINFGAILTGNGTAWFDSLVLEVDGTPYTNMGLFDLDFESPTLAGFSTGNTGYAVQVDSGASHTGRQSLRIAYTGPAILTKDQVAAECASVVAHMESSRTTYLNQKLAAPDVDWAIQNARVVAQAADLARNGTVRDPDMAANIDWIISQAPPGTKIVLWAHNGHVYRGTGAMGSYLAAKHGADYVVLGFAFHDGAYNAVGSQGLKAYDAAPSFPGSAEYILHKAGMPQFILDLRQARPDDPGSWWVLNDIMNRNIGAVPVDGFAVTRTLGQDYDALIFFDRSDPSALLPF